MSRRTFKTLESVISIGFQGSLVRKEWPVFYGNPPVRFREFENSIFSVLWLWPFYYDVPLTVLDDVLLLIITVIECLYYVWPGQVFQFFQTFDDGELWRLRLMASSWLGFMDIALSEAGDDETLNHADSFIGGIPVSNICLLSELLFVFTLSYYSLKS